jgi:membrane protein implicated in regulation of membrane protease activity
MTWSDFYLICFAIGFLFSFLSFVMGGFHWHLPFGLHMSGGGATGTGHMPTTGGGAAHGGTGSPTMSPFNPATSAAFLAWFGGAGYLITRFSSILMPIILMMAIGAGLTGASIVFLFITRVLTSKEEAMDPADYDMVGVLGRISSVVRVDGTGEMIYSQAGTRRACGVRSDDGKDLAKDTEVVVTRYEKGIAYVRRWDELSGE